MATRTSRLSHNLGHYGSQLSIREAVYAMTLEETMDSRLAEAISAGVALARTEFRSAIFGDSPRVSYGSFSGWRAQSPSLLAVLVGASHVYTESFEKAVQSNHLHHAEAGVSILVNVRNDLKRGYLTNLRTLISAEVFNDFLEMADHLLDLQHKDPAAMLIGAVLEDGLRRIAQAKALTFIRSDGIVSLSQKCSQAGIYNAIRHRQVQVWSQIRNDADHGHFGNYALEQVQEMSDGVSKFLADFLT